MFLFFYSRKAKKITFGFCDDSKRLVDVAELLEAAYAHSLPGLGVCVGRTELLQSLRHTDNAQPLEEGTKEWTLS